jgi:uncharacterized protein (TIGR02448 family)
LGFCLVGSAAASSNLKSDDVLFISLITGAVTLAPIIMPAASTTDTVKEKIQNWKFVKDDAAAFVATEGVVKGPFLESALEVLREDESLNSYSDIQLTHALLAG